MMLVDLALVHLKQKGYAMTATWSTTIELRVCYELTGLEMDPFSEEDDHAVRTRS